jgi:hypothetical protein
MKARRRINRWLALGLALGAVAAPVAQAADRPDDRAGPLGVGTALQSSPVRPDDRAGPLGVGTDVVSRYLIGHAAVRPDDRAGPLGVGTDVVSRYLVNHPAAVRPDDRAGIRGVGTGITGIVTPAPRGTGSFWGTAELSAAAVLGAFAVALVGFGLARYRRSAAAALQS